MVSPLQDPIEDIRPGADFLRRWADLGLTDEQLGQVTAALYISVLDLPLSRTPEDGLFWFVRPVPKHPQSMYHGRTIAIGARMEGTTLELLNVLTRLPWQA